MRKIFLISLLLATGCPPKIQYPECKVDKDCADHGQVCSAGFCKECRDDTDCAAHPDRPVCANALCTAVEKPPPPAPATTQETCQADADCGEGRACVNNLCKAQGGVLESSASQKLGDCEIKAVYFGFDDTTLAPEARRQLDEDFTCLQKSSFGRAIVSGHCDERGTTEYNLALGMRRAEAVKRYLTGLGLDARRLKAVSYGKERPADSGHDEAAWSHNRRVEVNVE